MSERVLYLLSMERLFSWEVTSWVVGIAISCAIGILALNDFRLAKFFFLIAAADATGGTIMSISRSGLNVWWQGVLVFAAGGCICLFLFVSIRYVDSKKERGIVNSPLQDQIVHSDGVARDAKNVLPQTGPELKHPAISTPIAAQPEVKTRRFATLVPIVPTWSNSPIPFDTNLQDPHQEFYSDLLSLAGRPEKRPVDWLPYKDRHLEADAGSSFAIRLVQYYIFKSIYRLHRGTSGGTKITVGKGVTPIEIEPILPPDATPYANEKILHMLSDNEFLRPMDKMLWTSDSRRLQVPKGTDVSFVEEPAIPGQGRMLICRVRFERPSFYKLDFDVSSGVGANGMMPAGYDPQTVPGATTWTVTVTMRSEIQKRTDEGFQPDLYTAWVNALFDGLRKKMAFE